MINGRHLRVVRSSAAVASAGDHEEADPVAEIAGWRSSADPLEELDRPGCGVERVGPALIHEKFACVVLESGEVGVYGVDESAGVCVEGGDSGEVPVVSGGGVGEVVVD